MTAAAAAAMAVAYYFTAAAERDVNVTKLTVCLFPAFIAKTLCYGCLSHFCAETKRRRWRRQRRAAYT